MGLQGWFLTCDEPWTRYRALVDLLGVPLTDSKVISAKKELLCHPKIQALISDASTGEKTVLKRHNDAAHPIYKLSTLADFGLRLGDDDQLDQAIDLVLSHQSAAGAFQSLVNIPKTFGGTNEDMWTWILCDTPTLLYALVSFGLGQDERVQRAVHHLVGLIDGNGWHCLCDPELGKFRGPGKKTDPCPIANVYALKALSIFNQVTNQNSTTIDKEALNNSISKGTEMLLHHWEHQTEGKLYLFGIGTDFRKLKYPYVWYNILHVTEVLSRFPEVFKDPRFKEMVATITKQADDQDRYTASSMYLAWKGWSFANKKEPSPWLTFLVTRIRHRTKKRSLRIQPPH